MESKLMPCKCGGEDGWACWKTSDETYYLECESCGYKTKEHKTVADAETEWDKRNGVPMTTSEPTTGEMIERLKIAIDQGTERVVIPSAGVKMIADRLESQEREIAAYKKAFELPISTILRYMDTVNTLTSERDAEKARADAAIEDLDVLKDSGFCNSCIGCNAPHSEAITYCTDWIRRGQPQEGEGK